MRPRRQVGTVKLRERRHVVFGSDLVEPETHGKRWLIVSLVVVVLLLAGTLYLFFLTPYFYVKDPVVIASPHISKEEVIRAITPALQKKKFGVISTSHLYFLDRVALQAAARESIPLLQSVVIERHFPNVLRLTVTEKQPVAIWNQQESLYLLDEHGQVLGATDASLVQDNLPIVKNTIAAPQPTVGQWVLEERNLQFARNLDKSFSAKIGIPLSRFDIPTGFATEITAVTQEGWSVLFNTENDLDEQLVVLNTILTQDVKEKRPFLHYVDLRVNNLGFYK